MLGPRVSLQKRLRRERTVTDLTGAVAGHPLVQVSRLRLIPRTATATVEKVQLIVVLVQSSLAAEMAIAE